MYTASDLKDCVSRLPKDKVGFAQSLLSSAERYGLSDKQAYWVDRLTKLARGEAPAQVQVGDLTAVVALFEKAAEHLKYPKIVLTCGESAIRLSVAGARSSVPGSIAITSLGRTIPARDYDDEPQREWYGRINRDGTFKPAAAAGKLPALADTLKAFAADPAKVAAEHGRLTGNCCFCNLTLKDERSTAVGYGATCAKHYGLPWGK